jgi:hypothetical protein
MSEAVLQAERRISHSSVLEIHGPLMKTWTFGMTPSESTEKPRLSHYQQILSKWKRGREGRCHRFYWLSLIAN